MLTNAMFGDEQRFVFNDSGEISLHFGSHRSNISNSVAVWGCLSSVSNNGQNILKKIDGRLDTKHYKDMLDHYVVEYCKNYPYIHDHFPVHTSLTIKQFISSKSIYVLCDWPKQSGDLMLLENVWIHMAQTFKDRDIVAFDTDSLWIELSALWKKLCVDGYFSDVIQGMPQRLREVIVKDGNWIRNY
ncbi:hypothetical protein OUZ56_029589 [Daphnia magna]|uniref:Tc1-like transposase DDE domain-containing protein n=1 Tax=Daphnia magna TaxID=35525 RepID=A0ABR0B788_9CRUS|nr:hypothetical protein OUZ56_029589 [Daphnia magna]